MEWGLLLMSQEISRLSLFMMAMAKINIISSADHPLGMLLVASKCYI